MHLLDLTLPTAAENLALDEALLLEAETRRGQEVLRFWEWPTLAVVLGAGGVLRDDVDEQMCDVDGVPILRRSSGGGTVLLGHGCLLFSLVLSYDRSPLLTEVRPSYGYVLGVVEDALAELLPGETIFRAGVSDLTVGNQKFSGNAQQRKRRYFLHHGTLLHDFDLARVGRYLRPPPRQPEYRGGRTHEDFLRNLPANASLLKRRLSLAWQADDEQAAWPEETVRQLVAEKYTFAAWIRRR